MLLIIPTIIFLNNSGKIILKISYYSTVKIFFPLIVILIVYPEKQLLLAAEETEPFSTIAIRINGTVNSNRNTFHEFWEPEFGAELLLDMPFYQGDIQVGIHLYPYSGRSSNQPDFLSVYIFVGWGFGLRLSPEIRWYNGLQIGSYQMHFDDSDIHESQALESELGVGLNTRFDFSLTNSWSVQTGAVYLHVYTKKPLVFIMITAGLSYTFEAPDWLREFMK